jgi:hypothetical protein
MTLSGMGTVANYPNVSCELRNMSPQGMGFTASYVMGAKGELPQAMPMTIAISCAPN